MPVSFVASGDIFPCRFVKMDTADGKVLQCVAGDVPIGISQEGTRRSPYVDSSGKAAAAGEPLAVYTLGERALLECAATMLPGVRVKPDASGKGIAAAGVDAYGGFLQWNAASGKLVEV